jgi:hypothetical protein
MKVRSVLVGAAFCTATALWSSSVYSQTKDEKKPAAAKPKLVKPIPPPKATIDTWRPPEDNQAGDKPADEKPAPAADKPGDKPAAHEPDPQTVAWISAATPGAAHEKLKATEGSWNTVTKQWHDPASQPTETKGTCERKWIMDGRFLEEHYTGDFMGMPFHGMGIVGYDNVQKKYVTSWIDNMGTGILLSTGTCDESGKIFNYTGELADPMTGKMQKMRSVMKIVDDKTHVFEIYGPGEEGKEFKMLEITHTKK